LAIAKPIGLETLREFKFSVHSVSSVVNESMTHPRAGLDDLNFLSASVPLW